MRIRKEKEITLNLTWLGKDGAGVCRKIEITVMKTEGRAYTDKGLSMLECMKTRANIDFCVVPVCGPFALTGCFGSCLSVW